MCPASRPSLARRTRRNAYTLMEVLVVVTIMGILIAISAPLFSRAVEQSKLDMAAANLRSIWCAQRFYYLENGRYGTLNDLADDQGNGSGLLDPTILSGATFYSYSMDVGDGQQFTARAGHPAGTSYSGSLTIDQTGDLTCLVGHTTASGFVAMSPSMEPKP